MNEELPIRVLHVVTYMGRGGLETMLMNYYRKINKEKVQFDFLVHREFEADYDAEICSLGGQIYRIPRLNPFDPAYLRTLSAFFRDHREYKIVHSHLDCMSGIPLKYACEAGVPVRIAHGHSSSQSKNVKYPIKLFFKRWIPRYANQLFACSEPAGRWMFAGNDFRVMNNALDTNCFCYNASIRHSVREKLGFSDNNYVVGHVGRFDRAKNQSFLLDIFAEICKLESKARLLLIGDGALRKAMEEKAARLHISDRVVFMGVRTDVAQLMQAMDILVFPSKYEGLPVTLVEAQATGLPCVISDVIPRDTVITDDLVTMESLHMSPKEWAERVLSRKCEPRRDHCREVAAAGFSIEENAKWLEAFYLEKWKQ